MKMRDEEVDGLKISCCVFYCVGLTLLANAALSGWLGRKERKLKEDSVITAGRCNQAGGAYKGCFILTSNDYATINLSKSDYAEFGIILGDSPVPDYTAGFSFSYLDFNGNEISDSPVEVTGVKTGGKDDWRKVTVTARREGACYIRVSHKLALFSTDVLVVVTAE